MTALLPPGWSRRRVSELAGLVNGHPFDAADFRSDGEVPLVRIRDLKAASFETFVSESGVPASALIRNGDVLVGMDGDFNVAYWSRGRAALNQRVCLLRAKRDVDSRFLAYALPDYLSELNALTYATTVKHLASGDVLKILLPAPEPLVQKAVADRLDDETAKIDALVDRQEQLLRALSERRLAVTEHVLQNCGEGSTLRLRYVYNQSAECNRPDAEVLSVYREHGVVPKASRDDNHNRTPENLDRYLYVRPGDLVVNKMKAWQGSLGVSSHEGIVSPDYEVLRLKGPGFLPMYLHYLLRSPRFVSEYRARSVGIRPSQWRLYWEQLGDVRVGVLSIEEQRRAVTRLETELAQLDRLSLKATQMLDVLRERREALITAVISGALGSPQPARGAT